MQRKDSGRGDAVDNFRLITCLSLMWKRITGIIANEVYLHMEITTSWQTNKKDVKKCRGTKHQLLIDKSIMKDSKRRHTNLAMAWIDYRKAYDMVPHSWINECIEMFGIAKNVTFLKDSMTRWQTELIAYAESLGEVRIKTKRNFSRR